MSRWQYLLEYAAWRERTQSRPLLQANDAEQYGTIPEQPTLPSNSTTKKAIGFWSSVFIIFNRMIGTGIFATPATVLALSGSVGLSLTQWLLGGLFAMAGIHVYIIWGNAFPKNGGEKNYLQYLFPRPAHLVICLYAASLAIMGWTAANSLVTAEYFLKATLSGEASIRLVRFTSFICITISLLLHGMALKLGLRVQNALGAFKLFVLVLVVGTGLVALVSGIPVSGDSDGGTPPSPWRGRDNFRSIWNGTVLSTSSFCFALNSVTWSFLGYSNANYAMEEMKNPKKTIRVAGPLAVISVTALFIFSNIAYLAGASKEEIATSGRLVVALLMRNMWGEKVERFVDMAVALSTFGSVLAMVFAHGRVNQELAKEGIFPFSNVIASNKPFDAPLAGVGLHWLSCVLIILFVPSGDLYNLIVNMGVYPFAIINTIISFALLSLFFSSSSLEQNEKYGWNKLSLGSLITAIFFGVGNVFLLFAPFIPPPEGSEPYQSLPFWSHAVASWVLLGLGGVWWVFRFR
ncbi:hypothetical protein NP233_g5490 [Leucocoprinus birnbaumii]|uniref:High affinity methionine permease n=1 Tax=Leucocoprinus birnbaumii TaxID=56174 RepID=A0AAD5VU18_9AGAR|nr:hypothetical protein NP233_g5490 [Leucocoprinus birnbaumii]